VVIDVRGLHHPEHLKEFKNRLEGLCAVFIDIEVLLDDNLEDLRKFEIYVRSCRAAYTVEKGNGYLTVKITAPFNMCG
jgi:hypothetical protein